MLQIFSDEPYHDIYGSFPPPFVADANGRPAHSWRVLILPQLLDRDDLPLLGQYQFDEPWNSSHNLDVGRKINALEDFPYRCPSEDHQPDQKPQPDETSYLAVIGPHTIWRPEQPVALREIVDGTSNTLSVVEVAQSGIHWLEPRDLHVQQMSPRLNDWRGQGVRSSHENPGGRSAHAALCDGTVRMLDPELSSEALKQLLIIDDGAPLRTSN
jgi:hypothetical protein